MFYKRDVTIKYPECPHICHIMLQHICGCILSADEANKAVVAKTVAELHKHVFLSQQKNEEQVSGARNSHPEEHSRRRVLEMF